LQKVIWGKKNPAGLRVGDTVIFGTSARYFNTAKLHFLHMKSNKNLNLTALEKAQKKYEGVIRRITIFNLN
jgi:hypothetical protein